MIGFYTVCKDFRPGTTFYEDVYGERLEFVVINWPEKSGDKVTWKAINHQGATVRFLITRGLEHRGPKLYWEGP